MSGGGLRTRELGVRESRELMGLSLREWPKLGGGVAGASHVPGAGDVSAEERMGLAQLGIQGARGTGRECGWKPGPHPVITVLF